MKKYFYLIITLCFLLLPFSVKAMNGEKAVGMEAKLKAKINHYQFKTTTVAGALVKDKSIVVYDDQYYLDGKYYVTVLDVSNDNFYYVLEDDIVGNLTTSFNLNSWQQLNRTKNVTLQLVVYDSKTKFYQGPGPYYGTVSGNETIPADTQLTSEYNDGAYCYVKYKNIYGFVYCENDTANNDNRHSGLMAINDGTYSKSGIGSFYSNREMSFSSSPFAGGVGGASSAPISKNTKLDIKGHISSNGNPNVLYVCAGSTCGWYNIRDYSDEIQIIHKPAKTQKIRLKKGTPLFDFLYGIDGLNYSPISRRLTEDVTLVQEDSIDVEVLYSTLRYYNAQAYRVKYNNNEYWYIEDFKENGYNSNALITGKTYLIAITAEAPVLPDPNTPSNPTPGSGNDTPASDITSSEELEENIENPPTGAFITIGVLTLGIAFSIGAIKLSSKKKKIHQI